MDNSDSSRLSVILSGPYLSHSGFSKTNRELAFRLTRMGVNVKTDVSPSNVDVDSRTEAAVRRLSEIGVPEGTPVVYSMTMPPIISGSGPKVLFTMMESSGSLHKEYSEKMDLATEIWVPTSHMVDLLAKCNVHTPVKIVPLGVDDNVFGPKSGKMALPNGVKGFKFLSVSWWGPRKGFDVLIKAFVGEFSGAEDVCLIISSRDHGKKTSAEISAEIRKIAESVGNDDRPQIMHFGKATSESELASLYNACNVFVLASRGEGFSLPIVEAASCGLPVITTNCTAQATYLDDSNSYLLDPEGYEVADPRGGNASSVGKWCRFYEGQKFPTFGKTSISRLGDMMRSTFEDRITAKRKADALRDKVRNTMTWDDAARSFIGRLSELVERTKRGGKR